MGKTNQLGVLADVFTSDASNNVGIGGSPSGSYKLEVTGSDILVNGIRIGKGAGSIASNTAIGLSALSANTTGTYNTAIGNLSLQTNTTGYGNTSVGYNALGYGATGFYNAAIGVNALLSNTTGTYNNALGTAALYANTTGSYNTAVGQQAGTANTTGSNNTYIGYSSGFSITTGSNNTIIGAYYGTAAMANNIVLADGAGTVRYQWDGTNNVFGNPLSGTSASFSSTATATAFIPSGATVPTNGMYLSAANTLDFATNTTNRLSITSAGNVGIGTSSPAFPLHIYSPPGTYNALIQMQATTNYSGFYAKNTGGELYLAIDNSTGTGFGNGGYSRVIYSNGSYPLDFYTNDLIRMRITSGGNVGIGTSSPDSKLQVAGSCKIDSALTCVSEIVLGSNGSYPVGGVGFRNDGTNLNIYYGANNCIFKDVTNVERMRITNGGNVNIGNTSNTTYKFLVDNGGANQAALFGSTSITYAATLNSVSTNAGISAARFFLNAASSTGQAALVVDKYDNNSTTSQAFIWFSINNQANGNGQINANGANQAAFGGFSDARLKENIAPLESQLNNILSLKPSEFDYKDGGGHQIGFIAQEFIEVYPDAIHEDKDGMLMLTGWGKTEARLVKAIQEQQALITSLQDRLDKAGL